MGEARPGLDLAGMEGAGGLVPGQHRLGAGAAGRGADTQYVAQGIAIVFAGQLAAQCFAVMEGSNSSAPMPRVPV